MPAHLVKKSSAVVLNPALERKAGEIADAFFNLTGKDIVLTDGNRTALDQATQVYAKILSHDLTIYTNQKAAQEIKAAYDSAVSAGKSKGEVIKAMAAVIEKQIRNKVYISKHLTGKAFDVRSRDMTTNQKKTFKQVVQTIGGLTMIEEGKPPHFHIQLI
jgi:hypothetical protein